MSSIYLENNNVGKPAFEFGPAVNVPKQSLENLGLVFVLPEGGHHKPGGSAAGRQSVTLGFCFYVPVDFYYSLKMGEQQQKDREMSATSSLKINITLSSIWERPIQIHIVVF